MTKLLTITALISLFAAPVIAEPITGSTTTVSTVGEWQVNESISKFNDRLQVTISKSVLGEHGSVLMLFAVICQDNTTFVGFEFPEEYFFWETTIGYRFDKEKPQQGTFNAGGSSTALLQQEAVSFIKEMIGHDSIHVEAGSTNASLDISGLEDVIRPFHETCNW